MRVCLFPNEYYSSITPRLLHISDSYSPALDQYSGDTSSFLTQPQDSAGVSLSLCGVGGEKSALGSINDQLLLRECSV